VVAFGIDVVGQVGDLGRGPAELPRANRAGKMPDDANTGGLHLPRRA
jgi:hypothetical protein